MPLNAFQGGEVVRRHLTFIIHNAFFIPAPTSFTELIVAVVCVCHKSGGFNYGQKSGAVPITIKLGDLLWPHNKALFRLNKTRKGLEFLFHNLLHPALFSLFGLKSANRPNEPPCLLVEDKNGVDTALLSTLLGGDFG